jgi:hypothetical protein
LEAIARGETPVWDTELKKYVYGDDTEVTLGGSVSSDSNVKVSDPQAGMDIDEDLPF